MTYEMFLDELELRLCGRLGKEEGIHRVRILKNNGIRLDGFSYQTGGQREQPTVYVNQFFQEGLSGKELEKLAEQILKIQRESQRFPKDKILQILDYKKIKRRIFYRLISREKNQELLSKVPYLPWLDLAIVFYMRIPEDIIEHATALIHTSHMERWGITLGELYRTAAENMAGLSMELIPMEQLLDHFQPDEASVGMYILRNRQWDFGAAMIVSPKILKRCHDLLGEDFYILPSSIHEVILFPVSRAFEKEALEQMVQEVNASCVEQEDFLSGHVYRYSSGSGRLDY